MLYHLFKYLDEAYNLPGSGMFQYLSFRAAAAVILSLLIVIIFGRRIIDFLRRKQIGEEIRDLGLQGQLQKKGTPTMGGVIILIAILVPMLLVGKHAQRRASVAQRGVLVFLHAVEFANDVAAVQACPKEIDPERSLAVHGLGQSHLQPRQRKTLLDHRGAGKRLAAAFALRVGAVHCPDGVPRACVPVADPAELGDEGAWPASGQA